MKVQKWHGKDSPRKDTPYLIGSDRMPGISKLLEEMNELGVELSKLMGNGRWKYKREDRTVRRAIEEEIADVEATIEFFKAKNRLDRKFIEKRRKEKVKKFKRWHRNIQEGRDPNDDGKDDRRQRKPGRDKGKHPSRKILASNSRRADDPSGVQPKCKKQSRGAVNDAAQRTDLHAAVRDEQTRNAKRDPRAT